MNWLWINIPLMAVFFLAVTGIPLWLVFKHPDRRPAQEGRALPDSVAVRQGALQPEPIARAARRGYAVPSLVQGAPVPSGRAENAWATGTCSDSRDTALREVAVG